MNSKQLQYETFFCKNVKYLECGGSKHMTVAESVSVVRWPYAQDIAARLLAACTQPVVNTRSLKKSLVPVPGLVGRSSWRDRRRHLRSPTAIIATAVPMSRPTRALVLHGDPQFSQFPFKHVNSLKSAN